MSLSAGLAPTLCGGALAVAGLLHGAVAAAATQMLVISGIGGEAQYEERFSQWSEKTAAAAATATGNAEAVVKLSGAAATREAIQQRFTAMTRGLSEGDQFVLVLIGHGTYDGSEYRLNIPGPDLTGSEIAAMLDRIPAGVPQLIVNTTSTSGAVAERWAKANRVVITATRSGGERNATRFAGFWAEAVATDAADRDKDGAVTAQEAYDYAVRKVADAYKADAAMQSEHPKISGNDPGRFIVARLGASALFATDAQLIALRKEQSGIEGRLAQLKPLKAQLSRDEYFNRIEPVMLELARLGERVDARLAALGVKSQGGGNANP